MGLAAALDSIDARIRGLDGNSRVFAYLDDLVVVVAPGQAEAAHNVVEDVLVSHGLALNADKTCVWSRESVAQLPASLLALRKPNLRLLGADVRFLDRRDDREALGAPVRGPVAATPLVEAAAVVVRWLEAMQEAGLSSKTAYTILHTYAQGGCNHLLRANYEVDGWLEELEEVLQQGLALVVKSSLDDVRQALASLRLVDGGVAFGGLRSESEAAFLGSWGLVLKEVATGLGVTTLEGFSSRFPTVWADMGRAERALRLRGGNGGRALD